MGLNVLIEGTQGSALSLLHSYWPYCTSIDTNAAGIISEVGIAPSRVTNVLMVVRTYPIRVAGNSGPMKGEITWEELSKRIGKDMTPEKTTVTKKVRRIAEWDDELFAQSCILNAPTEIALTFADYVDPEVYGATSVGELEQSYKLMNFLKVHGLNDGKLVYIGTGPDTVVGVG
jgi:adenylosuccinate synthase